MPYFAKRLICLLAGLAIESFGIALITKSGLGICMEAAPGLIMVPGEGVVRALVIVTKARFGTLKVCFDVTLIVIAGILSFVFFGRLNGLGVGTIVAAAITGLFVNAINRRCRFVPAVDPHAATQDTAQNAETGTARTCAK